MQVRLAGLLVALAATTLAPAPRAQDLYDEGVLRTLELTFKQQDYWTQLTQNRASKTYIKADLKVGNKVYPDVGVRFRGNSSYNAIGNSQKKPFKIVLDEFVPNQDLLGYRTINLNNSFRDPTFTREVLCYWIFRHIMPASKCNYVLLKINGQSWGPYINVEQINKDLLRDWFEDDDGNRYRGEISSGAKANASALTWLGQNLVDYQRGYEVKNETPDKPWEDVRHLCDVLNNTALDKLPVELPKVLDVEEALRYSVGQVVVPAIDSYIGNTAHNYYLYNDGFHQRFVILPWDLNASFGGNNWLSVQQKITLSPFYMVTTTRPLLNQTLAVPHWRQRYLAHIRGLLDGVYDWSVLGPRIAGLQKFIEPELRLDTRSLYTMQQFYDNVTRDITILVNNSQRWIPGLQPFIQGRTAFLRADSEVSLPAPAVTELARSPAAPTVNDDVAVSARVTATAALGAVTLYWRVKGPWLEAPMFDDGKHGDQAANDGIFGAFAPKQAFGTRVEYYVGAAHAGTGAMTFAPRTGDHLPPAYRVAWPVRAFPVQINELLARNTSGARDEKGEQEDWIELYCGGNQTVPLGGLYLTDDLAKPTKWRIPANTSLAPGQTLLVWADDEPNNGPLHATFKLEENGEEVALFDSDGVTLLDHYAFGPQVPDVSTGRLFDGGLPWVTFLAPSANTVNFATGASACGYRAYSALDPRTHTMSLAGAGTPRVASQATWQLAGGPPSSAFLVFLAGSGGNFEVPGLGLSMLFGAPLFDVGVVLSDAQGAATLRFAVPNDPQLAGVPFYSTLLALGPNGLLGSNGLEARFCR